ncbi:class I SAM-dependent methyltransferase [Roseobacter sp. WL0113]|uniref:Class I SAM-dependent methyltransferase n=2 Tax=Roseobacter sinensis TaxID=2931391 RepID=A0ABT3BLD7_9RHOB|nr:class I SAM-dependent methyltransferase [Roseobacter sp. WL0113]
MSFKGVYENWAEHYDLMHRSEQGGMNEIDGLCKKIFPSIFLGKKRILEIGCGTGQVAAALARMGHEVTAIDFSDESIKVAKGLAKKLELEIRFISCDFLEAEFKEEFDVAFALSSFVTHFLSEEELSACLSQIHRCLTPEGVGVISLYDYGKLMKEEPDVALTRVSPIDRDTRNYLYFQRRVWNGEPRSRIHECSYFLIDEGQPPRISVFSMDRRAIPPIELSKLLSHTGFERLRWFSPEEASYYQSVCVCFREPFEDRQVALSDTPITTAAQRNYLVWDGTEAFKPDIVDRLSKDSRTTFLHFTHIVDTQQEASHCETMIKSVKMWIDDLQERFGALEVSSSFLDRSNFEKCEPKALAQSYLAAQVMMSAQFSPSDEITLFSSTKLDESLRLRCTDLIRAIARTEEISQVAFVERH